MNIRLPRKLAGNQAGLTIVELLLAMAISSLLAGVLLSITVNYYGSIIRSNQTTEMYVEAQQSLRAIIEDIRLADSINASGALADTHAPGGGWVTSDAANVLIIGSPAITNARDIIYDSTTGNPYRNELVYFVSGNALYKRTIQNPAAAGNTAVTSCPEAASSSSCPPDKVYSQHTNNLTLTYYDTDSAVTANPTLARSVKIGVQMSRKSFGKTITINDTILATLRNK
jgi:Tfp pilus assembly protein PilW